MKVVFALLAVTLLVHGVDARAAAVDQSADEILKKTVQSVYAPSEQSVYVMKLKDKDGSELMRKMRVWFRRDGAEGNEKAKLLIKFAEPAEIRGTGLLSVGEKGKNVDQWLYLPSVKKVRRIKGGNENESFLGSDFTVGDLSADNQDQFKYEHTGSAKCGEADCYVLTGLPKPGVDASSLPYSKKVLHVRKDNYMSVSVEFYNPEGKLEKVMSLVGVHKEQGNKWMADKTEMKNVLTGHLTTIEVEKRDTKAAPADSMFTPAALERN